MHNVTKKYGRRVQALCGIDLKVERGEVFGLLGPNGAGKSTLVKIMMTVVRPSHAEGTMLGHRIGHKPTLAQVGYLPEHHRFPPYLTAFQALDFFAALCNTDRATRRRRADELLVKLDLERWRNAKANTFSKGMQQRLGLAIALVHNPQLVVLDEPTDGLDPIGRRDVRAFLQELKAEGKTVFINSHLLSEVEQVCDRVAILAAGKVVRQGTIDDLTAKSRRFEIVVSSSVAADDIVLADRIRKALPWNATKEVVGTSEMQAQDTGALLTGEAVELKGSRVCIVASSATSIQPVIDGLRRAELVIESVQCIRDSLEDSFIEILDSVAQPQSKAPLQANVFGDARS